MATALQICNSALIKLGAPTISSLASGSSKSYDLCTAQYPRLRNALLRNHIWVFAKVVDDALTTATSAVMTELWDYQHTIPTTIPLARIISFSTTDDILIPYERVGAYIYSNEEDPRLRYVRSFTAVDDAVTFPDDFGEALANLLAADICVSLTQNTALRDTHLGMFERSVSMARFNGAIEDYPYQGASQEWIAAHDGLTTAIDPSLRGLTGY